MIRAILLVAGGCLAGAALTLLLVRARMAVPSVVHPPMPPVAEGAVRLALERERAKTLELEANADRLEEARARLLEANAELEGFAFAASHDLGTPLRTIEGYAEIILATYGPQLDDRGRELISRLHATAGRMRRYVRDLLTLSRMRPESVADPTTVAVAELVAAVSCDLDLPSKGEIVVAGVLPVVEVPEAPLRQALQNLLDNGIKYNHSHPPKVTIRGEADTGLAVLWIEDNGVGIAEAEQERVFDLFIRGPAAGEVEGSGAGLTIARRAIRSLGGEIWIERSSPQGSVFALAFPVRFRPDLPRIGRADQSIGVSSG
jgi:signal transduction histidine kinase